MVLVNQIVAFFKKNEQELVLIQYEHFKLYFQKIKIPSSKIFFVVSQKCKNSFFTTGFTFGSQIKLKLPEIEASLVYF